MVEFVDLPRPTIPLARMTVLALGAYVKYLDDCQEKRDVKAFARAVEACIEAAEDANRDEAFRAEQDSTEAAFPVKQAGSTNLGSGF